MNYVVSFFLDSYQDNNDNRDSFKNISWSPYDRMMIKEVKSFKDLCVSESTNNPNSVWIGVEQKMHLISNNQNDKKIIINDIQKSEYIITFDNRNYDFYCFVTLNYSPEINSIIQIDCINGTNVKNIIKQNVEELICKDNHGYAIFRSLGSENLVILLLSNSMMGIITSVNKVLSLQYSADTSEVKDVFSDVCVFSGLNKFKLSSEDYDKKIDVDVLIKLNLKEQNTTSALKWICEELKIEQDCYQVKKLLSKKSTIIINFLKNSLSYSAFGENGVFNENNKSYGKYIVKSRTYFIDDSVNVISTVLDLKQYTRPNIKTINYTGLNNKSSSNIVTEFIIREYKRMLDMPRFSLWHRILWNQIKSIISFMEFYDKHDKITGSFMLNDIQRALLHINQACSPISEVPYHNYLYSGSFNDLLMTYYGIIDQLLQIAYKLPHKNMTEQHSISFAICMNSSTKIESRMFTKDNSKDRFVIFYFPYDTLWNYSQNIRLLIHEVFHYVAPYERTIRAEYLLNLIFKIVLNNIFRFIIVQYCKKKMIDAEGFENVISDWFTFVLNEYEKPSNRDQLLNNVHNVAERFFVDPIPEWFTNCIDNKEIDAVLIIVYEFANKILLNNHNSFLEKIKEEETFSFPAFNKIFREFDYDTLKKVLYSKESHAYKNQIFDFTINNIKIAMFATKEAFCDIWAIDILQIPLDEYIHYILITLIETKDESTVWAYFNKSDRTITPDSAELRLNLLIDYFLPKNISMTEPLQKEDEIYNKLKTKYPNQKDIFDLLCKGHSEFIVNKSFLRSDLNAMAFYAQKEMYASIKNEEIISKLRTIYSHDLSKSVFVEDIDYFLNNEIYTYTPKKVCELMPIKKDIEQRNTITRTHGKYLRTSYARSVGSYIECINRMVSEQSQPLWFRGVCDHTYSLLPSLIRKYDLKLSLYANQSNVIKYAFLMTKSMTDVWDLPIEQQMACLQHYGASTNLLDFSLDMLVALYFTINPDNPKDKERIDSGEFQPVVYVFDPIKYCNAIRILHDENINSNINYDILPYEFDFNLNTEDNSKYFVKNTRFDFLIEHTKKYNKIYTSSNRSDDFPIPIIIRQSNPRIVAQDGTFVAFSLDASPADLLNTDCQYSYLDLLTIRRRYIDFCSLHGYSYDFDFIRTIYIEKASVCQMRKELEMLNIGKYRVYPELKNQINESMRRYIATI